MTSGKTAAATRKLAPEITRRALRFVQSIGKLPVIVKDSPGFVVNRVLLPYMMEAGELFSQGVNAREIESTIFPTPMTHSRCWYWEPARILARALIVRSWIPCSLRHPFPSRAGWSNTLAELSDHTQEKRSRPFTTTMTSPLRCWQLH